MKRMVGGVREVRRVVEGGKMDVKNSCSIEGKT